MPVILKLKGVEAKGGLRAYKLTDTKCVTEANTYNFTSVYGPDVSVGDVILRAYSELTTAILEPFFLCVGTGELNSVKALIDAVKSVDSGVDEHNIRMSAVEVHSNKLIDILDRSSRVTLAQGNDAVYRVYGWSSIDYAQGSRVVEVPCEAVRILKFRTNDRMITVIELPHNDSTSHIVKSLSSLVTLLIESSNREKTYFPYRDSIITKMLWSKLFCEPRTLNALLFCSLDSPTLTPLLQLGDRLSFLMANSDGKPSVLRPRLNAGSDNLQLELEELAELVRCVKQLRADANAAEYERRLQTKRERADELRAWQESQMRLLELKVDSLERLRDRKIKFLSFDKHQQAEWEAKAKTTVRNAFLKKELKSLTSNLEAIKNEIKSNQETLAATLSLTHEERSRGNIKQAEFNLRTLQMTEQKNSKEFI